MKLRSSSLLSISLAGLAIVLATTAFECPGPDPKADETSAGGASSSSSGDMPASTSGATMPASDASSSSGPPCMEDLANDPMHCGACFRACSTMNTVELPACEGGLCVPFCKPGFVDASHPPPPFPDDGCETPVKRVFVTSLAQPSNLGGATGADGKCQQIGQQVFGAGTVWKAWISDSISPQIPLRFTPSPGPYVLAVSGIQVAANFGALVSGNLDHAIDETENGMQLSGARVWTGTKAINAEPSMNNCSNWSMMTSAFFGDDGDSSAMDATWTQGGNAICVLDDRRLYCFEQ